MKAAYLIEVLAERVAEYFDHQVYMPIGQVGFYGKVYPKNSRV